MATVAATVVVYMFDISSVTITPTIVAVEAISAIVVVYNSSDIVSSSS